MDDQYFDDLYKLRGHVAQRMASASTNANVAMAVSSRTDEHESATATTTEDSTSSSGSLIQVSDRKFQGDLGSLDPLVNTLESEQVFDEIWLNWALRAELEEALKRSSRLSVVPGTSSEPDSERPKRKNHAHEKPARELISEIIQNCLDKLQVGGTIRIIDSPNVLVAVEKSVADPSFACSVGLERVALEYTTSDLLVIRKIGGCRAGYGTSAMY